VVVAATNRVESGSHPEMIARHLSHSSPSIIATGVISVGGGYHWVGVEGGPRGGGGD